MSEITQAIEMKDWYAVAALVLLGVLWAWRRFGRRFWDKIPKRWRWAVPALVAGVSGFVAEYQAGAPVAEALKAALTAVFGIGAGASGLHAWMTNSKLPYNTKPPQAEDEEKPDDDQDETTPADPSVAEKKA